ncbi:DNA-directed RNA polymerase subunit beta'' [Clarias magur]|uniref:DNA-directed RNA polymerase subunit beta n=1 Tax=Clarias magur TaxID=1594786 RepID=A0A8J4X5P6_CLAMG|nr:DNA-directed RNA polymerase subunit beta'' [Clarias magur]
MKFTVPTCKHVTVSITLMDRKQTGHMTAIDACIMKEMGKERNQLYRSSNVSMSIAEKKWFLRIAEKQSFVTEVHSL